MCSTLHHCNIILFEMPSTARLLNMFRVQQLRVRRSEYAMKCLCYVTLVCELDCSSTYLHIFSIHLYLFIKLHIHI